MDKTYSSIPTAESHLCRAWQQEFEENFLGQNYVEKEKKHLGQLPAQNGTFLLATRKLRRMDYVDSRCSSTQSSQHGDETSKVKVASPCHEGTYYDGSICLSWLCYQRWKCLSAALSSLRWQRGVQRSRWAASVECVPVWVPFKDDTRVWRQWYFVGRRDRVHDLSSECLHRSCKHISGGMEPADCLSHRPYKQHTQSEEQLQTFRKQHNDTIRKESSHTKTLLVSSRLFLSPI